MAAWTPAIARDHRKLDAFHLADAFVVATYEQTARFPVGERFGLQSQLSLIDEASATRLTTLGDRAAGALLSLRRSLRH
jgi:hypothetical protein